MRKLQNRNILLSAVCFVLIICSFSETWAYFSAVNTIDNTFSTASPSIAVTEVFDPSDGWLPGEKKQKEVKFINTGNVDMCLRFRMDIKLEEGDGNPVVQAKPPLSFNNDGVPEYEGVPMVAVGWEEYWNDNFTPVEHEMTEEGTTKKVTWYYYNGILKAKEETENVMSYVQFADWITGENEGIGTDFQKYKVHVIITGELFQEDAAG